MKIFQVLFDALHIILFITLFRVIGAQGIVVAFLFTGGAIRVGCTGRWLLVFGHGGSLQREYTGLEKLPQIMVQLDCPTADRWP